MAFSRTHTNPQSFYTAFQPSHFDSPLPIPIPAPTSKPVKRSKSSKEDREGKEGRENKLLEKARAEVGRVVDTIFGGSGHTGSRAPHQTTTPLPPPPPQQNQRPLTHHPVYVIPDSPPRISPPLGEVDPGPGDRETEREREEEKRDPQMTPTARAKGEDARRASWMDQEKAEMERIEAEEMRREEEERREVGRREGRASNPSEVMSRGANPVGQKAAMPSAARTPGPPIAPIPIPVIYGSTIPQGPGQPIEIQPQPGWPQAQQMPQAPPPPAVFGGMYGAMPMGIFGMPGQMGMHGGMGGPPGPDQAQIQTQAQAAGGQGQTPNPTFAFGAQRAMPSQLYGAPPMVPPKGAGGPPEVVSPVRTQAPATTHGQAPGDSEAWRTETNTVEGTEGRQERRERKERERGRAMERLAGGEKGSPGMGTFGLEEEPEERRGRKKDSGGRKDKGDKHKHGHKHRKDRGSSTPKKRGKSRSRERTKHHHHHHGDHSGETETSRAPLPNKIHEQVKKMHHAKGRHGDGSRDGDREHSGSGRRVTKETSTSGPSFGHFGRPFSHDPGPRHPDGPGLPMPEGPEMIILEMDGPGGVLGLGNLGLDWAAGLGGILSPGMGMGMGMGGQIPRAPGVRSAYVETVVDDEDAPTVSQKHPMSVGHRTATPIDLLDIQDDTAKASHKSDRGSATPTPQNIRPVLAPSPGPHGRQVPEAYAPSAAPTTFSAVNRLAADSRFHDATLCELLSAADSKALGESARKAMRSAAKKRVLELLKDKDDQNPSPTTRAAPPSYPKEKSHGSPSKLPEHRDEQPPAWAVQLFDMLSMTNNRLDDLGHRLQPTTQADPTAPPTQDDDIEVAARAALHNILFPEIPLPGNKHDSFHTAHEAPHAQQQPPAITVSQPQQAYVPVWMPAPMEQMFAPQQPMGPPEIHIQPPTEQNSAAGGPRSRSQGSPAYGSQQSPSPGQVERELPQPPARQDARGEAQRNAENVPPPMAHEVNPAREQPYDPLVPPLPFPRPWDVVTQRLFSWALVWQDEDFVRALEATSLGYQVDEFALTIYMMVIFKRNLRHRICAVPPLSCDKLFVPPNMADAINRAVHAKRFADAQQILEELWYPFGFKSPPRVIVALAKHRNEPDHWAAHRFDLATGRLVTMSFSHQEKSLIDGRPFMWWHAIRSAWPQHNIPHPDHLAQKTQRILTADALKDDNSLAAANASRNFLLGWRPDRPTDMKKLRELVWQEVKRLYNRKAAGKLIIEHNEMAHEAREVDEY